ncbi:MAG: DUF58 domain-containing protein [Bacteroidota bacterium]|nr:DUF58 domain-containing protein [Bacteroidota bacterium]
MRLQEISSQYENLDLLASQVVEGFITGLHKSPFHGFSVEFAEHRLYNTGESTKNIDWKLYGRTDKLFVKRYDEETNLRCHILLDVSSSMYYPKTSLSKIKMSVLGAAVISNLLKKQRDAFALTTFNDKVQSQSEVRSSMSHYRQIINQLQQVIQIIPNETKTNVTHVLNEIAEQINRRSLVVIFSDMFDAMNEDSKLFDAIQHLRFKKHEVIIFHMVDKQTEIAFDFENRPLKFKDSETGEEVKLFPDEVKQIYTDKIKHFENALKLKCTQFKVDYQLVDTALDFNQIIMPFFLKRKKMK